MSILLALGAVRSNFTVPLTVAAVAGSIGVDAAGGFASEVGDEVCSLSFFLLHPIVSNNASKANTPSVATRVFLFITSLCTFLEVLELSETQHSNANRSQSCLRKTVCSYELFR